MEFVAEKDILAPPDRVFELMADARNETRWNSHVTRSELVSGEPVGAGSVFKTVNRGQEYTATITTHEPPNRVAFEVTGKTMDITAAFDFRAGSDVTHMAARFDFRPKGLHEGALPPHEPPRPPRHAEAARAVPADLRAGRRRELSTFDGHPRFRAT